MTGTGSEAIRFSLRESIWESTIFSPHVPLRRRLGAGAPAAALFVVAWLASPVAAQTRSDDTQRYVYGSSSTAALLRARLTGSSNLQAGDYILQAEPLRRAYAERGYEPIWTGSHTAEADAKLVLDALGDAEAEGLRAQDYRQAQLSAMRASNGEGKVALELLMTDSLLRYARDVRSGRVRSVEVESDAGFASLGFDYGGALAAALANGTLSSFLADLAPKHPEYRRLKKALVRYRAIDAAGGWPAIPSGTAPDGENGDLLRARLTVEDETAAQGDLIEALKHYQARNGLIPDGVLGPRTLAALNVPVPTRIGQIKANMERWRWMPREFEPRRIAVNVPGATLQYFDHGVAQLNSNVVVGNPARRTPVLRAEATAVTVNPVWYIPASIAWGEIWPRMRRNPRYLQGQGLILVGGQLLQPPGPRNALGRIKIEMPNNFGVYLHDTPNKTLFQREARTLSHGCVRVEQIAPLASLALEGDAPSTMGQLSEIIATRKTTRLPFSERIPVYLLYWTAIADDDGHAGFPRDVYGRDPLLLAALAGARVSPRIATAELGP
jgi:murein L,D-transpeptidase YcbB/YkuD